MSPAKSILLVPKQEFITYYCYLLVEVSGVARKKSSFQEFKKKNFLACVIPRGGMSSIKKISQFGSALWPAIVNINKIFI